LSSTLIRDIIVIRRTNIIHHIIVNLLSVQNNIHHNKPCPK